MEDNQPARSPLEGAAVASLPDTLFYVPEFISTAEESQLLQEVLSQPQPKWTVLSRRRLQTHPSALTQSNVLLESPLPTWLSKLIPRMKDLGIWDSSPHGAPNHVLVNEYNPNEGIMPHRDGAAYHPVVATVSLGAPIVLDIYENTKGGTRVPKWRILQEPRSLLVSTDDIYTSYLHGIQSTTADECLGSATIANWELLGNKDAFARGSYERKTRTSLTYRDVIKVSKVGSKLFRRRS